MQQANHQDLHDGRLIELDEESVQIIKDQADPKIQTGGYGDVYFSKYSNIIYLQVLYNINTS